MGEAQKHPNAGSGDITPPAHAFLQGQINGVLAAVHCPSVQLSLSLVDGKVLTVHLTEQKKLLSPPFKLRGF